MTPQEKAKELIDNFTFRCEECNYDWNAKQCALITVDEIINNGGLGTLMDEWWQEVKQEIQKL